MGLGHKLRGMCQRKVEGKEECIRATNMPVSLPWVRVLTGPGPLPVLTPVLWLALQVEGPPST